MKLKASSINNLTDARYFAAWNVEWLGFSLEIGQPNYTKPKDIEEIKNWLVGPKIVGEFGLGQSVEEIEEAIRLLDLDAIQLSRFVDNSIAQQIKHVPVIKQWVLQELTELPLFAFSCEELKENIAFFVLDFTSNNINWETLLADTNSLELLQKLCKDYKIILSIECPANQIKNLLDKLDIYGLSIEGSEEEKVGVKSFDTINELFEVLEDMELIGF